MVFVASAVPLTPPREVRVNHRRSRAVGVSFDCEEECQGGIFPAFNLLGSVEWTDITNDGLVEFRELQPQTEYSIVIRRRYRARHWLREEFEFGESSMPLNITTCPENMEGFYQIDNATCYAQAGFYENLAGAAESCKELESRLPLQALKDACTEPGFRIQNLPVAHGFWRPSLKTDTVLQCPKRHFCHGERVENSPNQYCTANHSGVYCSGCVEGFKLGPQGCEECDAASQEDSLHALLIAISLLILVELCLFFYVVANSGAFKCCKPKPNLNDTGSPSALNGKKTCFTRFKYDALSVLKQVNFGTKSRILLGYLQVYFSFQRTFNQEIDLSQWEFLAVLDFASSLNVLTILELFYSKCAFDFNHYDLLLFYTLMPVAMLCCLTGLVRIFVMGCVRNPSMQAKVRESLISAILFLLFVIYTPVSETVFATFWCEDFEVTDGRIASSALRADYQLSCLASEDPSRIGYVVYASFMVLIYPIGIVALYSALIYKAFGSCSPREVCHGKGLRQGRSPDVHIRQNIRRKSIHFLTAPYRQHFLWFETYELLRKLCQTSTLGFLQSIQLGSSYATRILLPVIALNTGIIFICVLIWLQPYQSFGDFIFAVISLFMLLPAAQIPLFDPFRRNSEAQVGVASLVWVEIGLFLTIIMIEIVATSCLRPSHDDAASTTSSSGPISSDADNAEKFSANSFVHNGVKETKSVSPGIYLDQHVPQRLCTKREVAQS